ncbi:MAG: hypothetical protein ACLSHC_06455 [Bilophila wadsworthia]
MDEAKLRSNVAILDEVQRRTGAKILMALKCFAMWDVFPIISRSGGRRAVRLLRQFARRSPACP